MAEPKHAGETPSPAPASISREAVKTLAIAVGVREAARQLGLNQNTVRQWSRRDKWFKQPEPVPVPATLIKQNGYSVTSVTTPSEALRSTLAERSDKTRLGLSKAAMKAAQHLGDQDPEWLITETASKVGNNWARTSSATFGWEAGSKSAGDLNLSILGNALVQVNRPEQS